LCFRSITTLADVPKNKLKFSVGASPFAFGSFWVCKGIGPPWPGADWAILGLIVPHAAVALTLVPVCRGLHRGRAERFSTVQKEGADRRRSGRSAS